MKAVVYDAPGQFELRDIPQPAPQAGQVLLKVLIAGICGTDLHLHHGEFGPSYPLIPGHEIVGEVIAHGSGVTAPGIGQRSRSTTPHPAVYVPSAGVPVPPSAPRSSLRA